MHPHALAPLDFSEAASVGGLFSFVVVFHIVKRER